MPATYEPIATTTLGSAASTITFNSIGSTYTDLKVILVVNGASAAQNMYMKLNNDSSALYSQTILTANGSTVESLQTTDNTAWRPTWYSTTYTSTPTFYTFNIFSYAGSTNKTALFVCNADNNGSGRIEAQVGLYRSTSAISRIDFDMAAGYTFNAGTTATLFGIKAA